MVIPFADNLNHEDVYVDYLSLSTSFLQKKLLEPVINKDYKDFLGVSHISPSEMKARTHFNRLEKHLSGSNRENFNHLENIWDIDEEIQLLESSSDEEELVNDLNEESDEEGSEEESDEEEKLELQVSMKNKYFIMRTGSEGGFLQGNQVFNCYGRLNNTDMLMEYGFCLLPNRYDSIYVRVIFYIDVKS